MYETLTQAQPSVARGAEFLDVVYPEWYEPIDIDKLDMRSMPNCIWGQLGGKTVSGWNFITSLARRYKDESWLFEHGFMTWQKDVDITPLWKDEVFARRVFAAR